MTKILIAVPCMDMVPAQFAQSLAWLNRPNAEIKFDMQIGSLIYKARNDIATDAIRFGTDYVMWFDSDMFFPPDTMERLLKRMEEGYDIVSGVYYRRMAPYSPVLFKDLAFDGDECKFTEFGKLPDEDIFEVGAVGFGCVMMKTKVLIDVFNNYSTWFTPIGFTGEDIAFCHRARELGYKIYADKTIPLGHVGHIITTEAFYNAFSANKK